MRDNEEWICDRLILYMKPNLEFTRELEFDDSSDYNMKAIDMEKFAIIFYDDSGELWKYLDVDITSNIIGDPNTNAGLCESKKLNAAYYHTDTTEDDDVFNLNNDETLIKTGDGKKLKKILKEKFNDYVNSESDGSQSSKFYINFFYVYYIK